MAFVGLQAGRRTFNSLQKVYSTSLEAQPRCGYERPRPPVPAKGIWVKVPTRAISSGSAAKPVPLGLTRQIGYRHLLSNLDPDRLRSEDLLDLSGIGAPNIYLSSGENKTWTSNATALIYYHLRDATRLPFPDGTHGFLYYRRSPHPHPVAGGIRFRVVRPDDAQLTPAERFLRGSDLLDSEGAPWVIHNLHIIRRLPYLRRKLEEDRLVPPMGEVEQEQFAAVPYVRCTILENIADPFILRLGNRAPRLLILRNESIFSGKICFSFSDPYTLTSGKILVRLEVANLPLKRGSLEITPRVVVRVLEIIEPPTSKIPGIANQVIKEGELVQKYDYWERSATRPWLMRPRMEERFLTPSSRKVLEDMYLENGVTG